ncbi:MAG: PTS sugar transporter subunit IIA [Candidatus Zixiibacteriota bacterium]
MNIARLLDTNLIDLHFSVELPHVPDEDGPQELSDKHKAENKEAIIDGLVRLLERSDKIGNRNKLLTDFIHRERKATTAIGYGIAIPHIRTYQAKELIIGVAISQDGYEFDSPDGEPVRMFFVMAAPNYDESLYLKVFKALAELFQFDYFRDRLLQAEEPYDIVRAFQDMV